jgi:hypothetical protein
MKADHVAIAIVTASRALGADPFQVAEGYKDNPVREKGFPHCRARAYAALALARVFPKIHYRSISEVVGATSPDAYLYGASKTCHKTKWWDPALFLRVVEAVEGIGHPAIPEPPPVKMAAPANTARPPRPFVTPSKNLLLAELRQAVENTAKMTPKE